MTKKYSIAEARSQFAALVHEVEEENTVEITRRGQVVAVLLSRQEYERIASQSKNYWEAYQDFRMQHDFATLDIQPKVFQVRDKGPGRNISL